MNKCLAILLILLAFYNSSKAQLDTIRMLPYAQIVVQKGVWLEKNRHDDNLICTRTKLLNKVNPSQSVRIKIQDYEEASLKETIEKRLLERYGNESDKEIETHYELIELRADLFEIAISIKPSECTDERDDILSEIGDGIELQIFLLDLGNHSYLEIEPDNENFSAQSFRDLNGICKDMALHCISLTPEKADSIAGFPVTTKQVEKVWNECLSDTTQASNDILLRKMYCLAPEAIREELNSVYTSSFTDSLYLLNDPATIEKYYLQIKKGEEFSKKFYPVLSMYMVNYTYSEHLRLNEKRESEVYPLEDYINAIFGRSTANDLCRLSTLNEAVNVYNVNLNQAIQEGHLNFPDQISIDPLIGKLRPITYREKTFFKALELSVLNDTSHIISESHNLIEGGIWMTLETTNNENKQILFQLSNGSWTHQEMAFPAASGPNEIWTISELSTPTLTVFKKANAQHFYLQNTSDTNSEWVEIRPLFFDSSAYIMTSYAFNRYYVDFSKKEILYSTLKKRGQFEAFVKLLLPSAKTKSEVDAIVVDYEDNHWVEVKPDVFLSTYTLVSALDDELKPEDKIEISDLIIEDLDNDSLPEIYHYALSNGKIIALDMHRETPQGVVKVKNSEAKKLLMQNNDFRNELIDTLKGNYEGYKFLKKG